MPNSEIALRDVYLASRRVRLLAQRTPLIESQWLSQRTGEAVYLKAECLIQGKRCNEQNRDSNRQGEGARDHRRIERKSRSCCLPCGESFRDHGHDLCFRSSTREQT